MEIPRNEHDGPKASWLKPSLSEEDWEIVLAEEDDFLQQKSMEAIAALESGVTTHQAIEQCVQRLYLYAFAAVLGSSRYGNLRWLRDLGREASELAWEMASELLLRLPASYNPAIGPVRNFARKTFGNQVKQLRRQALFIARDPSRPRWKARREYVRRQEPVIRFSPFEREEDPELRENDRLLNLAQEGGYAAGRDPEHLTAESEKQLLEDYVAHRREYRIRLTPNQEIAACLYYGIRPNTRILARFLGTDSRTARAMLVKLTTRRTQDFAEAVEELVQKFTELERQDPGQALSVRRKVLVLAAFCGPLRPRSQRGVAALLGTTRQAVGQTLAAVRLKIGRELARRKLKCDRELVRAVLQAYGLPKSLTSRERRIIEEYYLRDLTEVEIAKGLGCSQQTVSRHKKRAEKIILGGLAEGKDLNRTVRAGKRQKRQDARKT